MIRTVVLLMLLLAAAPAFAQDENAFKPFPFHVRDFTLQERGGSDFSPRDLHGKIWVAHFFFPGCTGVCTRTVPNMKRLQDLYRGKPDVAFVSIALNNDTIDTLKAYAEAQNAEPEQWLFLTGPELKVHGIVNTSFWVAAMRNVPGAPGNEIMHSDALFLIDTEGNAVGYVEGGKPNAADLLKTEIDRLRTRRRLSERVPITGADLPWFNAILNSSCTVLLLLGWIAIRLRFETLHKILMLSALAVSMVFLASYLFFHFVVMEMEPTRFPGTGTARYVYFTILLSHTLLAIVVAPLALVTALQGLRDARRMHVKIARWTLPIWLYVSVTGVVVYWMLYRIEW